MAKKKQTKNNVDYETALMDYLNHPAQDKFTFTYLKDGFLVRIPKDDEEVKNEPVDAIHVCNFEKVVKSIKENIPSALGQNSGYVRDNACARCHAAFPEDLLKQFDFLKTMHARTIK